MGDTFRARINGKLKIARLFKPGDRVKNDTGNTGTVIDVGENPLFVEVGWDEPNRSGKTWLAVNLEVIE